MNPDRHMDPDSYQKAWHAQSSQTRVTIAADLLLKEMQRSQKSFRATIFRRDFFEVAIGLLMLPLWFYLGHWLSLPWTWYLTVPALIWVAGFILVDRRRHPQRTSEPGEPLLFYVKESLTQIEHQIWLLRNVFWWYLLPFCLSIMAFFLQVAWNTSSGGWGFVLMAAFLGLFLFVIYGGTYHLNQRAVRNHLEPRRQDLLKLVASLQGEASSEDSGDIMELVSALANPVQSSGLNSNWAENWNRIVPSWRVAAVIVLPTLGGALCGLFSGLHFQIRDMGPTLFQTVVGAVIPFEIALGLVWWRFWRKQKQSALTDHESNAPASEVAWDDSATKKRKLLPRAPAMVILFLTVFLGIMAFVALYRFVSDVDSRRGPGLDDVSEFGDDGIAHLDAWLQTMFDDRYPSLSVAIVRDGEIVYQRALGFEDIKAGRPATPQTQYHVASVTKAFTASLAVILHERGVVDLDQPVVKYLPDDVSISTTPELGATITLRQLASHTSGLPRGVPGCVQSVEGWYQLEPQRLYDHLANVELKSDPGAAEEYSNLGFGLLGHALERAADKPFDRLMQELLCDPLKLEGTAIQADDTLRPATGYSRRSHFERKHSYKERLAASGGLVASVEDLAKFLAAQMRAEVFSSEMLDQLHTETKLSDGSASGNALGWSVRSREPVGRILKKNGGRSNCSAWIGFAPELGVGVAVVTNCGGPDVDPIGYKLLEQSVPLSRKMLVTKNGYAKVAPYTGVRWEGNEPKVKIDDEWFKLVSLNELPASEIVVFSQKTYDSLWQKRFEEDLVELLTSMGHPPQDTVKLVLESLTSPPEMRVREDVPMTAANRRAIRDAAQARERDEQ